MATDAFAAMRSEKLVIQTASGPLELTVEVAATVQEQTRGLMERTGLPDRHGMLFDFGEDGPVAFWMKNTLIPLDMLFIDSKGFIRHIHAMAEPLSERNIPSPVPVRYVLEIIGGDAARLGIATGDRMVRK